MPFQSPKNKDGLIHGKPRGVYVNSRKIPWRGSITLSLDGKHWAVGAGKFIILDDEKAWNAGFRIRNIGFSESGIHACGSEAIAFVPLQTQQADPCIYTISPEDFTWERPQRYVAENIFLWSDIVFSILPQTEDILCFRGPPRYNRIHCLCWNQIQFCYFPSLNERIKKCTVITYGDIDFFYTNRSILKLCSKIIATTKFEKEDAPHALYSKIIIMDEDHVAKIIRNGARREK